MKLNLLASIAVLFIIASCSSVKKIAYLQSEKSTQQVDSTTNAYAYPRIKPNDMLFISVLSPNSDVAATPFNLPLIPQKSNMKESSMINMASTTIQNYVVDQKGDINMPSIGLVNLKGLTRQEAETKIANLIYPKFLTEKPIVTARLTNFKVSILGEVIAPGVVEIEADRFTIFEAIAQAKDLSIYGNRTNVLLIREDENGIKKQVTIDLTSADLMNSPYYYLQQNDLIYVQPNKTRANASRIGAAETLTVSIIGTLISLSSLIVTIMVSRK